MPRPDDLHTVPPGLPAPADDGACDHLRGMAVIESTPASVEAADARMRDRLAVVRVDARSPFAMGRAREGLAPRRMPRRARPVSKDS